MPVEFISATPSNASSELFPNAGKGVDADYIIKHAQDLDHYGFNYTLIPYGSCEFRLPSSTMYFDVHSFIHDIPQPTTSYYRMTAS